MLVLFCSVDKKVIKKQKQLITLYISLQTFLSMMFHGSPDPRKKFWAKKIKIVFKEYMAAIPDTLSRPRPQRAAHRPGCSGARGLLLSVSGRVSPFDIRTIIASNLSTFLPRPVPPVICLIGAWSCHLCDSAPWFISDPIALYS